MGKYLTEEELKSTLKHSSIPTIIVEGKDDLKIYRWIEEDINASATMHIDIMPCGCRNTLIKLYNSRSDFKKVLFIAAMFIVPFRQSIRIFFLLLGIV